MDRPDIILTIDPVPAPRITRNQMKLIHVPDQVLDDASLSIKKRIIRYLKYKNALAWLAKAEKFTIPDAGMWAVFHVPMADSWPDKKKKQFVGKPHQQTPDTDNYLKAFKDALAKTDQYIYDERASKYWSYQGRIEIFLTQMNN